MTASVLVLVLSHDRSPYDVLFGAQLRTWDSIPVNGVATSYYLGGDLATCYFRLAAALEEALGRSWDFVFRTNASSYVDKARLLERAGALPRERCYQGVDGGGFASGSGFFLSKDCAEILRRDLPDCPVDGLAEDEAVGWVLARAGVGVLSGAERYDYWLRRNLLDFYGGEEDEVIRAAYHLRCKSDSGDRGRDVAAMEAIHRIKMR